MKKFISAVLTAAIMSLCFVIPSFAAQSADFKITLAQQSDKSVTVTFDFVSGTGFCALDFEIKYNNVKLTLNECEYGDGYTAFSKYLTENGSSCIGNINKKANPIKAAMAFLQPFKIVGGGSLVKMTFSKIPGAKLSENDITVEITNCQTSDFKDIAVNVTSDLSSGGSDGGATQYPQMTSVDGTVGDDENEIGEKITSKSNSASQSKQESSAAQTADDSSTQSQTSADDSAAQSGVSSNVKTALIIVAAVICLAGIGTVIVIYIKNKNRKNG